VPLRGDAHSRPPQIAEPFDDDQAVRCVFEDDADVVVARPGAQPDAEPDRVFERPAGPFEQQVSWRQVDTGRYDGDGEHTAAGELHAGNRRRVRRAR